MLSRGFQWISGCWNSQIGSAQAISRNLRDLVLCGFPKNKDIRDTRLEVERGLVGDSERVRGLDWE